MKYFTYLSAAVLLASLSACGGSSDQAPVVVVPPPPLTVVETINDALAQPAAVADAAEPVAIEAIPMASLDEAEPTGF